MPTIPSNTSHARSFSAISRLFISKSPPGFIGVTILSRNFFVHSNRQIFGSSAYFPGSQVPPNNLSRCIYLAQKFGVSHNQCLCCRWCTCSLLQQSYPVSKSLICRWEVFPPNYLWFHLQYLVIWRHQNISRWDCCCCMSNFYN